MYSFIMDKFFREEIKNFKLSDYHVVVGGKYRFNGEEKTIKVIEDASFKKMRQSGGIDYVDTKSLLLKKYKGPEFKINFREIKPVARPNVTTQKK